MSFGFGVSDFIAVGALAWKVYKSCKGASTSFGNISNEILSLHAVLKEAEETLFVRPMPPQRQKRLKEVCNGCDHVLKDLDALVDKYHNLSTQSKLTWDRMKYGIKDIAELRARLTSNVTMLGTFISTCQFNVEIKLDRLMVEYHKGRREGSIISVETAESLCANDRDTWRAIRKELEDIGISVAAFDANKDFIFQWFTNAYEAGEFHERKVDDEEVRSQVSKRDPPDDDEEHSTTSVNHQEMVKSQAFSSERLKDNVKIRPKKPAATPSSPSERDMHNSRLNTRKIKVSRLNKIFVALSLSRQRLKRACKAEDLDTVLEVLYDKTSSRLLTSETLKYVMRFACMNDWSPVIGALFDLGTDVNARIGDDESKIHANYPLSLAVSHGSYNATKLLIHKGANVNAKPFNNLQEDILHTFMNYNPLAQTGGILVTLVDAGASVNNIFKSFDSTKNSILHGSSYLGSLERVKFLVQRGAEVDICKTYDYGRGLTPLMLALLNHKINVARYLLEQGADPTFSALDQKIRLSHGSHRFVIGRNPLDFAVFARSIDQVFLLIDTGADLDYGQAIKAFVTPCDVSYGYSARDAEKQMSLGFLSARRPSEQDDDIVNILALLLHKYPNGYRYLKNAKKNDEMVSILGQLILKHPQGHPYFKDGADIKSKRAGVNLFFGDVDSTKLSAEDFPDQR